MDVSWIMIALLFGFILTWGFEIRVRDMSACLAQAEDTINELETEIVKVKQDLEKKVIKI